MHKAPEELLTRLERAAQSTRDPVTQRDLREIIADMRDAGASEESIEFLRIDALRWRQLPAHLAEFQINYVGLKRAIDADMRAQRKTPHE